MPKGMTAKYYTGCTLLPYESGSSHYPLRFLHS